MRLKRCSRYGKSFEVCNNFGVPRYSRNVLKTSLRVTVLLWSWETILSDWRSNCWREEIVQQSTDSEKFTTLRNRL